jgi:pyruvate/2-oxoglutarate dehydrogenase complex dihydrolipoamide acyltransferase (E2) component
VCSALDEEDRPVAKVVMPQLGESVAEGTIGKWLKQPGDHVAKDEPLLEVITDKVNAEVPSPFEGVLEKILVEEGATVPHDAEIAIIAAAGGDAQAAPKPEATAPTAPQQPAEVAAPKATAAPAEPAATQEDAARPMVPVMDTTTHPAPNGTSSQAVGTGSAPDTGHGDPNARMTPAVRMLLREHGLSPELIEGTGHGGRITREDVMRFVEQAASSGGATRGGAAAGAQPAAVSSVRQARPSAPAPAPGPAPAAPSPAAPSPAPGAPTAAAVPAATTSVRWEPGQDEILIPLNQMRRGIANQMTKAAAVPTAFSTFEVDVTAVAKLRAAQGDAYKSREGVGLSYLPFVIKAVVEALHSSPDLNAHYTDEGLLRKRRINIGVAIAVENGLIVPVIHDADQLSINGINRAIQDLSAKARTNRLRIEDLQGGTFTVDNTGWFGSQLTVPILNVPEVCILTTEAVTKRPIVRETPDGDVIAIRSMMNLVAGYDHRATDGAQIGRFVNDVICWLEAVGPDMPIY